VVLPAFVLSGVVSVLFMECSFPVSHRMWLFAESFGDGLKIYR